jgi:hypothetical protein
MSRGRLHRLVACASLLSAAAAGCGRELVAGERDCSGVDATGDGRAPDGTLPSELDAITAPWSTGFERQFCDYLPPSGFCYEAEEASYEIVESPVRSGRFAAAFRLDTAIRPAHARCARRGAFPVVATYGAWYYINEAATLEVAGGNWNLFHFRGGAVDDEMPPGLWDVSLRVEADDGELHLYVRDFLRGSEVTLSEDPSLPPVPIREWFHIEVYWRRATDDSGEFAVYRDGELSVRVEAVPTDNGSARGIWYVGNLADPLTPSTSTLYVDDVTILDAP